MAGGDAVDVPAEPHPEARVIVIGDGEGPVVRATPAEGAAARTRGNHPSVSENFPRVYWENLVNALAQRRDVGAGQLRHA